MYGSSDSSYAEADFWQPIWQAWDKVAFGDLRVIKGTGSSWEGNIGGGYRWLAFDERFLLGAYTFYDYKNSTLNNTFQQITLGGEIKTLEWTGRINGYIPVGTNAYRDYSIDTWKWSAPNANGYQNLLISNGYEYGLGGFDLEGGRLIPGVAGLTAYAGMFYFNHSDINQAIVGPRLRAEYDLTKVANIPLTWARGWVKNAQIEVSWQYDSVRGNLWNMGLQVSIPFSNKPSAASSNELTSRMTDYVRRDVNIVSVAKAGLTNDHAYSQNGEVWEFAQISSGDQLIDTLANATQPDAYVIINDIVMPQGATQSSTEVTSTDPTQLPDDILMTGGNFLYEGDHSFTFSTDGTP